MDLLDKMYSFALRNRKVAVAIIFAAFIVVFYGATIFHGFVQDDVPVVEKNPYIKSLQYIPKAFTSCLWEYANQGCEGKVFYYRPVVFLSYIFVSQVSPAPWVFHLAHLLYFFAAVLLIFIVANAITQNFVFSFASAFIFLIHPINSQVANWVSTDPDILFLVFALLTLLFYVRHHERSSSLNFYAVYVFYFLALLSKETAVILPLVIFATDIFIFNKNLKTLFRWAEFQRYAAFAIPLLIYLFMRSAVLGSGNYLGQFSFTERIYAAFVLFAKYLGKLFYPYPLQAAYDFKITTNLLSFTFLISTAAVLAFCAVFIFSVKRGKNLFAFALAWMAVFLAPAVIFLQAAGAGVGVFLERYSFASAVGFSFAAGYVLCNIIKIKDWSLAYKRHKWGQTPLMALVAVLAVLVVFASWFIIFQNNKYWKNNETLFTRILSQVPQTHGIRYQLGQLYYEKGDLEKARLEFEDIINRDQNWQDVTMAYKGLGDYWRAKGDADKSLEYYQKAVDSAAPSPRDYITFNDLGVAYMDKGNYFKGLTYFCQSLQLLPENKTTMDNFNAAASAIEFSYAEKGLYEAIEKELYESPEQKIMPQKTECNDSCYAAFSFLSEQPEILLPFLIVGQAASTKENVTIKDPLFAAERGLITLRFDKKFRAGDINFIFPTCQGIYYKVESP